MVSITELIKNTILTKNSCFIEQDIIILESSHTTFPIKQLERLTPKDELIYYPSFSWYI